MKKFMSGMLSVLMLAGFTFLPANPVEAKNAQQTFNVTFGDQDLTARALKFTRFTSRRTALKNGVKIFWALTL